MQLIFAILYCFCAFVYIASVNAVEEDDKSKEDASNLLQLMQTALADKNDHEKANEEFRELYGESVIEFSYVSKENQQCLVVDSEISINFDIGSDFLKAFGKSIKKISIAYNLAGETTGQEIGKLVNIHCSETLEEFEAKLCKDGAFNEMKIPFKNVKIVSFNGEWFEVASGRLGLDQLFPAMEVLNLKYNFGYIFHRIYPNLVEINAAYPTTDEYDVLIDENPQLKTLRIETTSVEFIKHVQEKLPELETFAFKVPSDLPSYEGPVIQFDNLKEVSISDYPHNIRFGKLSFKNLKRFELLVDGNVKDEWIELMGSNSELESIEISDGTLNDVTILALSTKFPNLIEAKIRCDAAVSPQSIVKFIKNKKRMKTIVLELSGGSVTFFKSLKKRLNEKWQINSIDKHYSVLKAEKLEEFDSLGNGGSTDVANSPNTSNLGGSSSQNNAGNNTSNPQSTNQKPGNGNGAATVLLSKTLIVILCAIIVKSFSKFI